MKKFFMRMIIACMMATNCIGMTTSALAATPTKVSKSVETSTLNESTKKIYYAKYIEIAKEVSKETGLDISILPMDEFHNDDWRTPNEYRKFLTKIANCNIRVNNSSDTQLFSNDTCIKYASIEEQDIPYTIAITGKFTTQYNSNIKRQLFANVTSISSSISNSNVKWSQTDYNYLFIESGRTCRVYIVGDLTMGGAAFKNKIAYVEFYCDNRGGLC